MTYSATCFPLNTQFLQLVIRTSGWSTEAKRLEFWVTLWLFNIAMENGQFIDYLPIKNGDFHGYVK